MIRSVVFQRSDSDQPEDGRTVSMLVAGQQIEHTAKWSAWEWVRFCAKWLGLATVLAAVLLIALEVVAPWK